MQKLLCGNDKKFQLDISHCLYCLYKKNNSKEKWQIHIPYFDKLVKNLYILNKKLEKLQIF